jgi:allantoin racemase
MRILVTNIPAAKENSKSGKFFKAVLVPIWRQNFDLFKRQDTTLTFRFASKGEVAKPFADCDYIDKINPESMIPAIIQGEKDGFEAAIVTCFHDAPTLKTARSLVNIPVVGIAESSFIMANLTGRKFGVVVTDPSRIEEVNRCARELDPNNLYIGATYTSESGKDQELALTDAREAINIFKKSARKLISAGAETIIPSCGLLSPAFRIAPKAEKEYPNGFTRVEGVSVMDLMGNAVKLAEMLVDSKHTGLTMNKRKSQTLSVPITYEAFSFWDC